MQEIKVYNIFNAPKGKNSPHGEHVYEWEYLDDDGKLKKDKLDVHEKIQSYVSRVDYKKQIERGELELNGMDTGVSKNYTGLPADTVDIYKWLTALSNIPKEQVTKLVEQARSASKTNVQNEQATNKESTSGGQTVVRTVQNQPANSESTPVNNDGGTKK